ncbi:hypothetical protein [Staphylococcus simulans]|uniref:hypothetical protein n=1 Tax=Staphylococcus simulans TaxID=1286 RepID=UPI000D1DF914|nr:hypothetical protein [Staphylococcus simulans]MDY5060425.1 hypothetical protein [Staphylococcus simulans]PTJ20266.1 hypothetical protein BU038_02140 [Staphylococcus simulans]
MTSKKLILMVMPFLLVFFIAVQPIDAAEHFGGSENKQTSHYSQEEDIPLGTNDILTITSLAVLACASFLLLTHDKVTKIRKRRYIKRYGLPKIEIEDVIQKYPSIRNKVEKKMKEAEQESQKKTES